MPTSLQARPVADEAHWAATRDLWNRALRNSLCVAIATVGEDGAPHVSPIGSLTLGAAPGTGTLLQLFSHQMGRNLDRDPRVTVLAVDSSATRFVNGLRKGRFDRAVATRLSGTAGPRRWATDEEIARFRRRVRPLRRLRGHDILWGAARIGARDITFDFERPVNLGAMTAHLHGSKGTRGVSGATGS